MKKLLVYIKDYRKETVLAPLFKMMEAVLELFVPLVVAAIIDVGIAGGDASYVARMVIVLILLGAAGLAFSVTAQYFSARAAAGFAKKLRHVLFSHIQKLSYAQLDAQGTSTLITRMTSDMNQVQSGVNLTLRLLLRSPFIVIGSMVMAFTVDKKAAIVFAVDLPALAAVIFGIMRISIPLYRRVQGRLDSVTGLTRENLTGARVLRAFGRETEQIREFKERNERLADMQKFVGRISALLNPVTYVIVNAAVIALIMVGAIRVDRGLLTQGAVVALYNYMAQILTELIKLANLIINITRSVACGNRIQSVLEVKPSVTDAFCAFDGTKKAKMAARREESGAAGNENAPVSDMPESVPAVEFRHVSLRYPDASADALTDINLRVEDGETIGVIGGTGSGKSSLVNMIPRFYDCTKGQVLVRGIDVRKYKLDRLRGMIGTVPQKAVLFSGTVAENLRWGKSGASEGEMLSALNTAQAYDMVMDRPGGLDSHVEQGGKNFSGGQRQRLTIARAIVRNPHILILDDSSSALDYATDAALRKAVLSLTPKPALFIVSQRVSSVQNADRIIVLDDGRAVGVGTHDELLCSCAVYEEIFRSQMPESGSGFAPDRERFRSGSPAGGQNAGMAASCFREEVSGA